MRVKGVAYRCGAKENLWAYLSRLWGWQGIGIDTGAESDRFEYAGNIHLCFRGELVRNLIE